MVLTDRQRSELHSGIYEYLISQEGENFTLAAEALAEADSTLKKKEKSNAPLLEKKWTAVPRLQKKVLELERSLASNAKIHAHRTGTAASGGNIGDRRMLPRPPSTFTLKGHSGVVTAVAVHPVFTVAVSGSEDGTIKLWDHESSEYLRTLKGHTSTVNSLSFTPTGSHLVSASSDLSIKLWDFSTYTCVRTLRGHDHTISAVKFIPLPSVVVKAPNNESIGSPGNNANNTGIDLSVAGSSFMASASRDQTVKIWDLETGFCDQTISDHSDWVRCIGVRDSDGSLMATSGNDTVIYVYDTTTKDRKKIAELRGHQHVVESLSFIVSPNDSENKNKNTQSEQKHVDSCKDYIASGGRDRSVRLWSIATSQCLAVFEYHENWVRGVLIHPSGNFIISAGDDRTIRVMDIKSNRCLRTIENAHSHFVTSIAMHHTLPILVSGGVDQTVRCWALD
jgi:platelet-activating factor acetylhydrolase IB subunit alpha